MLKWHSTNPATGSQEGSGALFGQTLSLVGDPWCGLAQPIGLEVVLPMRLSPRYPKKESPF